MILFGPVGPEMLARSAGQATQEFSRGREEIEDELDAEADG